MDERDFFALSAMLVRRLPDAAAVVSGSAKYPDIRGTVSFYGTFDGVLVRAQITGLPRGTLPCGRPVFGFHIHNGGVCSGNESDPFADVDGHYNPSECPHPYHAGDLPPLFGANGNAFSVFLSNSFTVEEIMGKTVIIHGSPDDFTTQPSGNSGEKIACGEIRPLKK